MNKIDRDITRESQRDVASALRAEARAAAKVAKEKSQPRDRRVALRAEATAYLVAARAVEALVRRVSRGADPWVVAQ